MFACPSPTFPPDKCGHGGLEADTYSKANANANANANAVGPNSLLMEDFDIGDAWLDSFKELETFNSQHQPDGQPEARVHGGNAWADATRPMPILAQGQFKSIEELASFESSQSVLRGFPDGSYTDDSVLIRHQSGSVLAAHHYGSAPVLPCLGQAYSRDDMYTDKNTTPKPDTHHNYVTPTFIPAPGGHWAWVPSSKTNPAPPPPVIPVNPAALQTSMSMPLLSELQGGEIQDTTEAAMNTSTDAFFGAKLDLEGLELLDSLDFMDVADTLVGEYEGEFNVSGANNRKDYKHVFGSAPLPAVLEDSVSGGGELSVGSGNSMPSSEESLPPGAMPIPKTHLLRTSSSSGTLSMHKSASNPNLLLPASCPGMERPVRSAARRSMALAAAALRDGGTSSESEEDGMRDDDELGSYGRAVHHLRRSSGSLRQDRSQLGTTGTSNTSASAALGKKKHNPWSMEETNALIEGVRLLGVGKWAEIKRLPYPGISKTLETRSPVDLKDKWRNLNRVARMSKSNLKSRFQKAMGEVPPNV